MAPNEPVPPIVRVPAAIFKLPVKVFAPVRINVPVPALAKAPEPEIMPEKIVLALDPAVKFFANFIFPAPEIEFTVSALATLYVPFLPTITSVPDARDPETDNVPSVILVSPVYVFVPESVNVPEPECVKLPAPDITPLRVTFDEPLLFKVLEFKSMLPSTDKVDAVIFESILRSPSVETVNPPPAVIPPEPIVKSPAVVDVPEATIVKLPFPVALE